MNARQRRLFADAKKRHPELTMPSEPTIAWSEEDLALIKQGVGDKSRKGTSPADGNEPGENHGTDERSGTVMSYFENRGFGFLRPDAGGRDVFFHVTHLTEGLAIDLRPGIRVFYTRGTDRTGKPAASTFRIPAASS